MGLAMLWSAGARDDVVWSGRTFLGALFLGWGLFNLVEGVIDHHDLGMHHVGKRLHLKKLANICTYERQQERDSGVSCGSRQVRRDRR
jgi:uncharacterized membrane protein